MDSAESAPPRKRQRAGAHSCLACRRVKSKCEPKEEEGGACFRCSRLGVRCEYTGPSVPPGGRVRSGRAAAATNSANTSGSQHRKASATVSEYGDSTIASDPSLQDPALVLAQPSLLALASAGDLPLELLRKWTLGATQAHDLAVLGASMTLAAKSGRTLRAVMGGGESAAASMFLSGLTAQLSRGVTASRLPGSAAPSLHESPLDAAAPAANSTAPPPGARVYPLAGVAPSWPPMLASCLEDADPSTFVHLERCADGQSDVYVCPNFDRLIMPLDELRCKFTRTSLAASALPFLHAETVQDVAHLLPGVWRQALNAAPVYTDAAAAGTSAAAITTGASTTEVPVESSTEVHALNSEAASDKRAAAATALALCQALIRPSKEEEGNEAAQGALKLLSLPRPQEQHQQASSNPLPLSQQSFLQASSYTARNATAAAAECAATFTHGLACRRASVEVGPWLVWSSKAQHGSSSGTWLRCSGTLGVFLTTAATTSTTGDGASSQSSSSSQFDDVSSYQVLMLRPMVNQHQHRLRTSTTAALSSPLPPSLMTERSMASTGGSATSHAHNAKSRKGSQRAQRGAAKRGLPSSPPRSHTGRSRRSNSSSSSSSHGEDGHSVHSSMVGAAAISAQDSDSTTAAHQALASFLRAQVSPSSAPPPLNSIAQEYLLHSSSSSPTLSTQQLRRELLENSMNAIGGSGGGMISGDFCGGEHETRLSAPTRPSHQLDWTGRSSTSSSWPQLPHTQTSSNSSFPVSSDFSLSSSSTWSATASALKTVAGASSTSSSLDFGLSQYRSGGSGSSLTNAPMMVRPDGGNASFFELLKTAEAAQALEEQQQRPLSAPCLPNNGTAHDIPENGP